VQNGNGVILGRALLGVLRRRAARALRGARTLSRELSLGMRYRRATGGAARRAGDPRGDSA